MSMRVNTIITHLRAEDAHTLIEFLDQVKDALMQTYGDDVKAMLQEASQHTSQRQLWSEDDEPF